MRNLILSLTISLFLALQPQMSLAAEEKKPAEGSDDTGAGADAGAAAAALSGAAVGAAADAADSGARG